MKITANDGSVFEGTQAEYEAFLAFAKKELAEQKVKPSEELTFEGDTYRKVDRKAQAGDVVVFRKTGGEEFLTNQPYKVDGDGQVESTEFFGESFEVYRYVMGRTTETVYVYEKVEAEYVPQEGDIVVVTANGYVSRNSVGDIGKITEVKNYGIVVEVPSKPSSSSSYGNSHTKDEVRKATPAEVEAYENALHKASFRVGDYVKSIKSELGNEGMILKLKDSGEGLRTRHASGEVIPADFLGKSLDGNIYGILADRIVKATEQEVEDALEAVKWAKIGRKVNEAKLGDIVRVTHNVCAKPVGSFFEVANVYSGLSSILDENGKCYTLGANVELIAPVESTFK